MIVIVEKPFRMAGKDLKPGDRIYVKKDKAMVLVRQGLIKGILMPVYDKMIRNPNMKKEES